MKTLVTTSALVLAAMTSMAAAQGTGQDSPADRKDPGSLSAGQKQVTPPTHDRGENAPGTSSSGTSAGEEGLGTAPAESMNEAAPPRRPSSGPSSKGQ